MNCPRCGAPKGMIGWLCGHNGNEEHDINEDSYWENWADRMGIDKQKARENWNKKIN